MRFANPQMLWLLLAAVPLLAWFLWRAWRIKQTLITRFVQSRLLAQLTVGVSALRQKIRLVLLVTAVGFAILALARPQWGFKEEEAKQRGLDIVVAIDTSRSMLAEDVRPNRIKRAKLAAVDLMKLSKSDRLGLVAFAGDAFLQCPLTLDEQAFGQSLEAIDVGIIPQGGTALTAAIDTALTAFKSEGDNYKILVLFTDGEDHDSGAVQAAEKAAQAGLRIYTIGVGTPNGELLRITDENGVTSHIKDAQGNAVKSRLDEDLLKQIATETGGSYLPLRGANAINTLYEQSLAPLPKSEISSRLIRRYQERFQWPLALAIVLLLAEILLPDRKPVKRTEPTGRGVAAEWRQAVAACYMLGACLTVEASPGKASREYEAGRFQASQKEYQKLLEKEPHDARLHYNAGAAAYRAGQYEQAAKSFEEALSAPNLELQQRSYYNLGDSLYRLGEQTEELTEKIQHWEKSVKQFDSALKLKSGDADAKHNLEFVKKKLEELKQQQAKQQQNQKNQDQQDDQKQDQQKPDSKPSQDQQKSPQKSQQEDKTKRDSAKQDQPKDEAKSGEDSKPDKAKEEPPKQPEQAKQSQQPGKPDEKPGDQHETNAAPAVAGQMTPQQAEQLLDSQKGEEKALIFVPARRADSKTRIYKDW